MMDGQHKSGITGAESFESEISARITINNRRMFRARIEGRCRNREVIRGIDQISTGKKAWGHEAFRSRKLIGEKITRDRGATGHFARIDGREGLELGGHVTRKRADIPGLGSGLVGMLSKKSRS
jgi:hypothetical protein